MIELLLLGILIMQVIIFHNHAPGSGLYMKLYDILSHRLPKYLGGKTVILGKIGVSQGKVNYQKVRDKIKEVKHAK